MSSPNMNYFYNVEYYQGLCWDESPSEGDKKRTDDLLQKRNKRLYEFTYSENIQLKLLRETFDTDQLKEVSLYTTYPGLIVGSGYPHDAGKENTIAGGFFFDYVSGLPVITGSSLKGMLRTYFRSEEKKEAVADILRVILKEDFTEQLEQLEKCLFEEEDIYLGGFPNVDGGNGKILSDDYITPHKEKLQNPIPIRILKIRPNVKLTFLFRLTDSTVMEHCITAEQKREIFEQLLLFGGIGAKTNVGFGQFELEEYPFVPEPRVRQGNNGNQRRHGNTGNQARQGNNGKQNRGGNRNVGERICHTSGCNNKVDWDARNDRWFYYCRSCSIAYNKNRRQGN